MIKKLFKINWISSLFFMLVFVAFGLFAIYFGIGQSDKNANYTETATATIVNINHTTNDVDVQFDYNGRTYVVDLNYYSSSMHLGDSVEVKFNPNNPTEVSSGSFNFIFCIVGGIFCVIGIVSFISTLKGRKKFVDRDRRVEMVDNVLEEEEINKTFNQNTDTSKNYDFSYGNKDEQTYFFHYCGKANQGHCLEDSNKNIVYEAKLVKFHLFGPSDYEFINYKRGSKTPHKVGKGVTTTTNGYTRDSSFKLDGINIWSYIDEEEIYFKSTIKGVIKGLEYDVVYRNQKIGQIVMTGSDVYGESTNRLAHIAAPGFYKITTKEEYLDKMFLLTFALARTEISYQNM